MRRGWAVFALAAALAVVARAGDDDTGAGTTVVDPSFDPAADAAVSFLRKALNGERRVCKAKEQNPLFAMMDQAGRDRLVEQATGYDVGDAYVWHHATAVVAGKLWKLFLEYDGFKVYAEVLEQPRGTESPGSPSDPSGADPSLARYKLVRVNPPSCDIQPGAPTVHDPEEFIAFRQAQGATWTEANSPRFKGVSLADAYGLLGAEVEPLDSVDHRALRFATADEEPVPEAYDVRNVHGACQSLRSVHDQGQCGGCWAFAAASVMADRVCIKSKGVVSDDFSPQSLISCADDGGCSGGQLKSAFTFTEDYDGPGVVFDACHPFAGKDSAGGEKCGNRCDSPAAAFYTQPETLLFRRFHTPAGSSATTRATNEEAIMREIAQRGSVATVMKVYSSLFRYQSGVYRSQAGEVWAEGNYHAVKLVGWGAEGGHGYWIVQNSWGPHWGEKGFFRIARDDDTNFIAEYGIVAPDPEVPKHLVGANPCKNGGTHLGDGECRCKEPYGGALCASCAARCQNGGKRVEGGKSEVTESGCTCADDWSANGNAYHGCAAVQRFGSFCVVQEDDCGLTAAGVAYDWCTPRQERNDECGCECADGFFGPKCEYGMFVDPEAVNVCKGDTVTFHVYAADASAGDSVFVRGSGAARLYSEPAGLTSIGRYPVCDTGAAGESTRCPAHVKVTFTAPEEPGSYIAQYAKSLGLNEFGHSLGMAYDWNAGQQEGRFTVHNCPAGSKRFGGTQGEDASDTTCPATVLHCSTSSWSDWSPCSATCDGRQHRSRNVLVEPTKCGDACGPLREERACNVECDGEGEPVCRFSEWGAWSECSAACNGGRRTRSRTLLPGSHGSCGPLVQEEECNSHACQPAIPPACPAPDASRATTTGQQCVPYRYNGVTYSSGNCTSMHHHREWCYYADGKWGHCAPLRTTAGGAACIFPFEYDDVTHHDCAVLPGSSEPRCATKVDARAAGGVVRNVALELGTCAPCRQDCLLTDWGAWGACSAKCGGGEQLRERGVAVRARNGGAACTGARVEARACNTGACEPECRYSPWTQWSTCSKGCGRGLQVRRRALEAGTRAEGCDEPVEETRECNTHECAAEPADENEGDADAGELAAQAEDRRQRVEEEARKVEEGERPEGLAPTAAEEAKLPRCPALAFDARRTLTGQPCAPFSDGQRQHKGSCSVRGRGGREWCTTADGGWEYCAPLRNTTGGSGCILPFVFEGHTLHDCVPTVVGGEHVHACAVEVREDRTIEEPGICRPCVRDCVVSEWSPWSGCSAACGGGMRTRRRSVVAQPQNGGEACPVELEQQPCNEKPCPVDCRVGNWTEWSECTLPCGGGVQSRSRSVIEPARHGGAACPTQLADVRSCNTHGCQAPAPPAAGCKATPWSEWSECTASCGGGERVRFRSLVAGTEEKCGPVVETKPCNGHSCPAVRPAPCPNVTLPRVTVDGRTCVAAEHHGLRKPAHECFGFGFGGRQEWCFTKEDGSEWGRCRPVRHVAGAAEGKRCILPFRMHGKVYRDCVESESKGLVCPSQIVDTVHDAEDGSKYEDRRPLEWSACAACSSACILTEWTRWTECSAQCGGGEQYRFRDVARTAKNAGARCEGPFVEARSCNVAACGEEEGQRFTAPALPEQPAPGKPPAPRPSGGSAAAGALEPEGLKAPSADEDNGAHRTGDAEEGDPTPVSAADVAKAAEEGAEDVEDPKAVVADPKQAAEEQEERAAAEEEEEAEATPAVDDTHVACEFSAWGAWSECSEACGGGVRIRNRELAAGRLEECAHGLADSQPCNTAACAKSAPVQDCAVSSWSEWSACSAECGTGEQQRTRTVLKPAQNGGRSCGQLIESRGCNTQACKDCQLSDWTLWSNCTATCGGGVKTRRRVVVQQPTGHGEPCPDESELTQERTCNEEGCPVDCEVSEWGPWGECGVECGGGEKERRRSVTRTAARGGGECPHLVESASCNAQPCPVDCEVTPWSEWTQCNATCGGGLQTRVRSVARPAAHGGEDCPPLKQQQPCGEQPCPVDCGVSAWSPWGECSAECGGGKQTRARVIEQRPLHGGDKCPALSEDQPCNQQACPSQPQGCVVSEWGAWSQCSRECDGGSRSRTRTVLQHPDEGGAACPVLSETERCNQRPCDCEVSAWGAWSQCSATCGGGKRTRERAVVQHATSGGAECPNLREEDDCATHACPVDCELGAWGAWGGCDERCGGGKQYRYREVVRAAAHGGTCGGQHESRGCNAHSCDKCLLSPWSAWSDCSKSCDGGLRARQRHVLFKPAGVDKCPERVYETEACNETPCASDDGDALPECPTYNQTRSTLGGHTCHASRYGRRFYTAAECIPLGTADSRGWCFVDAEQRRWDWCKPLRTTTSGKPCSLPFLYGKHVYTDCYEFGNEGNTACAVAVDAKGQGTAWGVCQPCRHRTPAAAAGGASAGTMAFRAVSADVADADATPTETFDLDVTSPEVLADAEAAIGAEEAALASVDAGMDLDLAPEDELQAAAETEVAPGTGATGKTGAASSDDDLLAAADGDLLAEDKQEAIDGLSSVVAATSGTGGAMGSAQSEGADGQAGSAMGGSDMEAGSAGGGDVFASPTRPTEEEEEAEAAAAAEKAAASPVKLAGVAPIVRQLQEGDQQATHAQCPDLSAPRRTVQGEECVSLATVDGQATPATECRLSQDGGSEWCVTNEQTFTWGYCRPLRVTEAGVPCIFPFVYSGVKYDTCLHTAAGSICATSVEKETRELQTAGFCQACAEAKPDSLGPRGDAEAVASLAATGPDGEAAGVAFGDAEAAAAAEEQEAKEAKEAVPPAKPVDCELSDWTVWSECSKRCDGGVQYRTRALVTEPRNGGKLCGHVVEERACAEWECHRPCEYGAWSEWSQCSAGCGGGVQKRRRPLAESPYSMDHCEAEEEQTRSCNVHACPVDCEAGEWSEWSQCSQLCGRGEQMRSRVVVVPRSGAGKTCPPLTDSRPCNQEACSDDANVNCEVGEWAAWSRCSKECGRGVQNRTRSILVQPKGGLDCPATIQERTCNEQPCATDCHVGEWGAWSQCSEACGGGSRKRSRAVLVPASHGGRACPVTEEVERCNTGACAEDCRTGPWGAWTNCSARCGGGARTRVREITQLPRGDGARCPVLKQEERCNDFECTEDGLPVVADLLAPGEDPAAPQVLTPEERRAKYCDALVGPSREEGPCAGLFGSSGSVRVLTVEDQERDAERLAKAEVLSSEQAAMHGGVEGVVRAAEAEPDAEVMSELSELLAGALEPKGEVDRGAELAASEAAQERKAEAAEEALKPDPSLADSASATGATGGAVSGSAFGGDGVPPATEAEAEALAQSADEAQDLADAEMMGATAATGAAGADAGPSLRIPRETAFCDVARDLIAPVLVDAHTSMKEAGAAGGFEDAVYESLKQRELSACGGVGVEMDRALGDDIADAFVVVVPKDGGKSETLAEFREKQERIANDAARSVETEGTGPSAEHRDPAEERGPKAPAVDEPAATAPAAAETGATGSSAIARQVETARLEREAGLEAWEAPTPEQAAGGAGNLVLEVGPGVQRGAGAVKERRRREENKLELERRAREERARIARESEESDKAAEAAREVLDFATAGTGATGAATGAAAARSPRVGSASSMSGHAAMADELAAEAAVEAAGADALRGSAGDSIGGPGRTPMGAGSFWNADGEASDGTADDAVASPEEVQEAERRLLDPYPARPLATGPTGAAVQPAEEREPAARPKPEPAVRAEPHADPHDRTPTDFVRLEHETGRVGKAPKRVEDPRTHELVTGKRDAQEKGRSLERQRLEHASSSMGAFVRAELNHPLRACDRAMRSQGKAPVSVHLASLQSALQHALRKEDGEHAALLHKVHRMGELERRRADAKDRAAEAHVLLKEAMAEHEGMLMAGGDARSHKASKRTLRRAMDTAVVVDAEVRNLEAEIEAQQHEVARQGERLGAVKASIASRWATARDYLDGCERTDM